MRPSTVRSSAILLLHANEAVGNDRLIDDLWAGRPPATAAKVLQTYVSQLRKALGSEVIVTGPAGYSVHVEPDGLDLHRFEHLAAEAHGAEPPVAAERLREALALWRGPPLVEFAGEPWAQAEVGRLEELRLSALQDRIDAELALGRAGELVGELEVLVAEHPLSERLRGQLMLALYRADRQADALAAYRAARETLVQTLGIEPGAALRSLERAILVQDPVLDIAPPRAECATAIELVHRSQAGAQGDSRARAARRRASPDPHGSGRDGQDASRPRGNRRNRPTSSRTASSASSSHRSPTPSS